MTLTPRKHSTRDPQMPAGRVGRAHGLDGSFYVTRPRPRLLGQGATVRVGGRAYTIARRAGTEDRPIVRLEGMEDRAAVESIRGLELTVDRGHAPSLQEGEWWASDLEGCDVTDGERLIGVVGALVELPSCEALEVERSGRKEDAQAPGGRLLVPMVRDAIRSIDVAAKRVDVDMSFVEGE